MWIDLSALRPGTCPHGQGTREAQVYVDGLSEVNVENSGTRRHGMKIIDLTDDKKDLFCLISTRV
jgi:hypothetical protein